jgi:hypothetical protein
MKSLPKLPPILSFARLGVILLGGAALFASCGARVDNKEVKEFRVAAGEASESFRDLIKQLISDYNAEAGFKAMEYVDSRDQANSLVHVVEGLQKRDGKVGWGQWSAETERRGLDMPGGDVESKTTYTLNAELDATFVREHSDPDLTAPNSELKKLFYHEIGHGFQLDHDPDVNQVMYYDITGEKQYDKYWAAVRAFFGQP